jgi:hypothetical protein
MTTCALQLGCSSSRRNAVSRIDSALKVNSSEPASGRAMEIDSWRRSVGERRRNASRRRGARLKKRRNAARLRGRMPVPRRPIAKRSRKRTRRIVARPRHKPSDERLRLSKRLQKRGNGEMPMMRRPSGVRPKI